MLGASLYPEAMPLHRDHWLHVDCRNGRHRRRKLLALLTLDDGRQAAQYVCIDDHCRHAQQVVMLRPLPRS